MHQYTIILMNKQTNKSLFFHLLLISIYVFIKSLCTAPPRREHAVLISYISVFGLFLNVTDAAFQIMTSSFMRRQTHLQALESLTALGLLPMHSLKRINLQNLRRWGIFAAFTVICCNLQANKSSLIHIMSLLLVQADNSEEKVTVWLTHTVQNLQKQDSDNNLSLKFLRN